MTPEAFISKWQFSTLKESSAAQSHFNDLCQLLNVPNPTDADPKGEWYCFERGASKTAGGEGWADVWMRGHFGWEYKGKRKDLRAAYAQLQQYSIALENPPLLIVCDMESFVIHTNWTNTVSETHVIRNEDLADPEKRQKLRWVFTDPERLKPSTSIQSITRDAANTFASLAVRLIERGQDSQEVAHFVNRLVFCMFAEDIDLLPRRLFNQILDRSIQRPDVAQQMFTQLFSAMKSGGLFGVEEIEWFNGGLFDDSTALPLTIRDLHDVRSAAALDWSGIDPSIFGTLFERGLDPLKRSKLGAHYTDPEKIWMIVEPVVIEPLWREWLHVKEAISKSRTSERKKRELHSGYLERLRSFRVLDPACGSGNFLYIALLALKDLEHRVNLEAESLGLGRQFPTVGPEVVQGIEINPYAAELARITVWIGEIQWMRKNGFDLNRRPVLRALKNIECRDALLNDDGMPANWPLADATIGNPPFLGDKRMLQVLGSEYVDKLRAAYSSRVPPSADLVIYWLEKARERIEQGKQASAGFVTTQAVRRGSSNVVLKRIAETGRIFEAWSDEEWIVDGADVRVSIICFDNASEGPIRLNGKPVERILPNLSSGSADLSEVSRLESNRGVAFQGTSKVGPFDIDGDTARLWLRLPVNPNGRPNSDVVRPWLNGSDLVGRPTDRWIIDFGVSMSEDECALYEAPFEYVRLHVKPVRSESRREGYRRYWWRHGEPRPGMRRALAGLERYIATPRVSKYRIFTWVDSAVVPDTRLTVIARDDDLTLGILQSRIHEVWSVHKGGWHGVGNDPQYTATEGFETFPFPEGLEPNVQVRDRYRTPESHAISEAASRLYQLRQSWLFPPNLVKRVAEVAPELPDRLIPVDGAAELELKKRTLTNLYNINPAWLTNAHRALNEAVFAAYGWPQDLSDDEILNRLNTLNKKASGQPNSSTSPEELSHEEDELIFE